jgi:membrane dipeptidase
MSVKSAVRSAVVPPCRLAAVAVAAFAAFAAPAAGQADAHLARAKALLREVPLIDGHNDLPWEMRHRGWLSFDSLDIAGSHPEIMTDVARLRAGMVGAQFWSTYSPSTLSSGGAARIGMEAGDIVHRMVARYPDVFEMASTADDIVRIHRAGKIASMLGLEGGHMIENSLGLLRAFYRDGVRYLTLTHSLNTDWADASTDVQRHGGLTRFGEEVVREMNRLGMLVDLSHVSDSTMWDALRVSEAPVIYSHSSSRHFAPHPRNVPDDVARAVGEHGGVIMVTFVPSFVHLPTYEYAERHDTLERRLHAVLRDSAAVRDSLEVWRAANPIPLPGLGVIADHIEHLRDVAGVDHVGLGSDFDGISSTPVGLEDVSTFPALLAELIRRGWSDGDVKRVAGLNVLRVMREAERVAARLQRERPPSAAQIEIMDGWSTAPRMYGPGGQ